MTASAKFKFLRISMDELAKSLMETGAVTIGEAADIFKTMCAQHAVKIAGSQVAAAEKYGVHRNTISRLAGKLGASTD